MKKTLFILFAVLVSLNFSLSAQVKKTATKKAATTKKTPAKTTTTQTKTNTSEPKEAQKTETSTKTEEKKSETKSSGNTIFSSDKTVRYKAAIGVKLLWGISLTGKYFFKNNQAIEGILRYRSYGGVASDIGLAVLYEYHGNFNEIDGLGYYFGGGAYAGHTSLNDKYKNNTVADVYNNNTYFGISGVIGAEYKFEDLPIAISADWLPSFNFNGGGFGAENGGLGVKYTF